MRLAIPVDNSRHAQRPPGKPGRNEAFALDELVILAVAIAVLGKVPVILHAPMLHVGRGPDGGIHLTVDLGERLPSLWRKSDRHRFGRVDRAFLRPLLAEADPSRDRSDR